MLFIKAVILVHLVLHYAHPPPTHPPPTQHCSSVIKSHKWSNYHHHILNNRDPTTFSCIKKKILTTQLNFTFSIVVYLVMSLFHLPWGLLVLLKLSTEHPILKSTTHSIIYLGIGARTSLGKLCRRQISTYNQVS